MYIVIVFCLFESVSIVHVLVVWFVSHNFEVVGSTPLETLWGRGFSLTILPILKGTCLQARVGLTYAMFRSG